MDLVREPDTRQQILFRATEWLGASLEYSEILEGIARALIPDVADWCALYGVDESGDIERLAVAHVDPSKEFVQNEIAQRYPMRRTADNPVAEAIRTGKSVFAPTMEDTDQVRAAADSTHLTLLLRIRFRSGIAVPLRARGRVYGCLAVAVTESDRRYAPEDLELIEQVALRCGLAVDNARLHATTRRIASRMKFLAESSQALAASLDYNATLQNVARLAVPEFADACIVYIQEPDARVRRVATAHRDPEKARAMAQLDQRYPLEPQQSYGIVEALRTGQPEFFPAATEDLLVQKGWRLEDAQLILNLDYRSFILAPMIARGRTVGALSIARARAGEYLQSDLEIAQELAQRCALAVDNARLFTTVQEEARRKDQFLSMLAHELRNPLGALWNALTILQTPEAPEAARQRALEVAIRQIKHQVRMTDDLLDVSRLLLQKVRLSRQPVDICELLSHTLEDQRYLSETAGVGLILELPGSETSESPSKALRTPLMVEADTTRLAQVFGNLVNNAIKFSRPGSTVRITVQPVGNQVEVQVADQGEGIDPTVLPHVFDLFFQADRTLDRSRGGLGLGLALVRGLVEQHGGTVAARSAGPGQGATFIVRLPLVYSYHADFNAAEFRLPHTPDG